MDKGRDDRRRGVWTSSLVGGVLYSGGAADEEGEGRPEGGETSRRGGRGGCGGCSALLAFGWRWLARCYFLNC